MNPYSTLDDTDPCVSPPAAQAVIRIPHPEEVFGCCDVVNTIGPTSAAVPQHHDHRPHTGHLEKHMQDRPPHEGVSISSSSFATRRHQSSSSAATLRSGDVAVSVPITHGTRPPSNFYVSSPGPPLVTDDAFARASPGARAVPNSSIDNTGGEAVATVLPKKNASNAASNSPTTSSQAPSSEPYGMTSPASSLMCSNNNAMLPMSGGQHLGPYPAQMQLTLRGVATTGYPAAARNVFSTPQKPSGPPVNTMLMTGSTQDGSSGNTAAGQQTGLFRPDSGWGGRGNHTLMPISSAGGMSSGQSHQPAPYLYMMPGMVGATAGGVDGSSGLQHGSQCHNVGTAYNLPVPSMGAGYTNMLPSMPSLCSGSTMGRSLTAGTGSMCYRCNSSSWNGGNGQLSALPPGMIYTGVSHQYPNGSFRQSGSAYGGMHCAPVGSSSAGPMIGQSTFLVPTSMPTAALAQGRAVEYANNSYASAGEGCTGVPDRLSAPRVVPSFSMPHDNNEANSRRQPSTASITQVQSKGKHGSCAYDGELFMQSVNTDVLTPPASRPVSKKAERHAATGKKSEQQRTSSVFSSRQSADDVVPVFSAEENVQHDRRLSSWRMSSASPDAPLQRSQCNASGVSCTSQRRISNCNQVRSETGSVAASTTRPGFFRRVANKCSRIGREAASGLTRRCHSSMNPQSRHRSDDASVSSSASSISS
jgi:hypothetical protein